MTASQQVTATLAANVTRLRLRAGMSQRDLAVKAGVTQGSVSCLERQARPTSLALLQAVAGALGVAEAFLVTEMNCYRCGDRPPAGFICALCRRSAAA